MGRYFQRLMVVALGCAGAWAGHGVAAGNDRRSVTVVLVGDAGFSGNHTPVNPKGVSKYGKFQRFSETTADIAGEINGDLNFLNVETVITARNDLARDRKGQKGPYNFKTHPNGIRQLLSAGFNVFSLANNHSMDYGVAGLRETLKHVATMGGDGLLAYAGIGENREQASRPAAIRVNGADVAFAAIGIVTGNLPRHRAGANKPGQIAYRFDADFDEITRRLRRQPADYRMLSVHYGIERKIGVDRLQAKQWSDQAIGRDGIDLVIGHHPHVVRPVEIRDGRVIFYSLGNFLHHGTANMAKFGPCRDYGLLARVHLAGRPDGRLRARAIEVVPLTSTHFRVKRFASVAASHRRIAALNWLGLDLDNPRTGARGARFAPQPDGSGLFCFPGAGEGSGKVGKLCKGWRAPKVTVRGCGPGRLRAGRGSTGYAEQR